jgi:hypothetical protein
MSSTVFYCLLLVAAGLSLIYWSKHRRFQRLNDVGHEAYPSYWQKVVSKLGDGALLIGGYSLSAAAVLIVLFEYAWEWLVLGLILYVALLLDDEWYGRRR